MSPFDRLRDWWSPREIAGPPTDPLTEQIQAQARAMVDAATRQSQAVNAVASRLDSIVNTTTGLGSSRDKATLGRPDTNRQRLTEAELSSLWEFNAYAQHVVQELPDEGTRRAWKVVDSTSTVDIMADEDKRLDVIGRVHEATIWGRLYGCGVVVMIVDEITPTKTETPLRLDNVRRVAALQVYDANEARPFGPIDLDPRSPNYRRPLMWSLTPVGGRDPLQVVHWTRVLVFGGHRLPPSRRPGNNYMDASVLESAWDPIRNKTSIDQAAANTAQQLTQDVITISDVKDVALGEQSRLLSIRMSLLQLWKSALNMIVLSGPETYESKQRPVSGFDTLDANAKEALASAQGEPMTRLFGETPGGLNTDGESQRGIWAQKVSGWQGRVLRRQLERLYRVLFRATEGPTAGAEPKKWSVEFLPLDELTTQGQANLEKTHAETDAIRVQAQIVPAEHVAKSRYSAAGYQNDLLPFDPEAEDAALMAGARAELERVEAPGAPAPGSPGQRFTAEQLRAAAGAPAATEAEDAAEPTAAEVVALAEQLTAHGIARCEHGMPNRCRLCGIERARGLVMEADGTTPAKGPDGAPVWKVAWKPIAPVRAAAPAAAPVLARTEGPG